jgi:hypothetical protein
MDCPNEFIDDPEIVFSLLSDHGIIGTFPFGCFNTDFETKAASSSDSSDFIFSFLKRD